MSKETIDSIKLSESKRDLQSVGATISDLGKILMTNLQRCNGSENIQATQLIVLLKILESVKGIEKSIGKNKK